MSRRLSYPLLAVLCAVPRLAIVLHERGTITSAYTEKSDTFAQTFVHSGTYGFLPGEPSAYTQPLYGWFLVPVYWLFGRSWLSIGLFQTALAVAVAWLVYEIGRRVAGRRVGVVAAAIATLNPYLAWHDVHVNREIVDQLCAAALVLLTLVAAERPSKRLAALLGVVAGLEPPFVRPPKPNRWTPEEAFGYAKQGKLRAAYAAYAAYPNECVAIQFYEDRALS